MGNFITATRRGKYYARQSVVRMSQGRRTDNHPGTYGWQPLGTTPDGLVIWEKDQAGLMMHPAKDCWLLFWMDCWQPVDKHISELSENLETLKLTIELEIDNEDFNAAVMAA